MQYGAAAVCMAFDEQGQADNLQRRKDICARAYKILVEQVGFPAEDIIFDPNIFAVATGIEEHNNYGVDFIEATRWIKQRSEEHTSELQSLMRISYAVFCLKKKNNNRQTSYHSAAQ